MKNLELMKNANTYYSVLSKTIMVVMVFFLASCSGDDDNNSDGGSNIDPAFATLPAQVLKTYTGDLTYTGPSGVIVADNGTATIASTGGNTYRITFNNNVPSISGLQFDLSDGEYSVVSVFGTRTSPSVTVIGVEDGELDITHTAVAGVTGVWTFSSGE